MSESTILIFVLLFLFEVKHFICDYPLQNNYIVFGKGLRDGWILPLVLHSAIHGLGTLFILSMYFDLKLSVVLAVIDSVSHFTIDRIKAHPDLLGRYKPNEKGESCGKCGSCQERLEAFKENGIVDPLKYYNKI